MLHPLLYRSRADLSEANTAVDVRNVRYNNVTISNSDAGVMIKAYPDNIGTVTNITYTGFTLVSTAHHPLRVSAYPHGRAPLHIPSASNLFVIRFVLLTWGVDINAFWAGNGVDTGKLSITDVTFSNFVVSSVS